MRRSPQFLVPFMAGSLLAGCTLVTEAQLDRGFQLALGESALLVGTDLVVTFRELVADSRCPRQAMCVWAGNGEVAIETRREGVEMVHRLGTPSGPLQATTGSYHIHIEALDPYPEGPPIKPEDYRVRLRITTD